MEKPRKFLTLDALRGVAAIAVVQYHSGPMFGVMLFPYGHLAVDFFFMLSGFVLSFAYQQKIDRGGYTWEFLKTRFIRLYPLYAAGLAIGFGLLLWKNYAQPGLVTGRVVAALGLCGVALLPLPPAVSFSDPNAFPLNHPSWSLFGEAVANVLHVALLRRRSTAFLGVLAGLLLVAVCGLTMFYKTTDYGWSRSDVYAGLTRVMLSYVLGMLLYRLHASGKVKVRIPAWVACLLLLGILAFPTIGHHKLKLGIPAVTVLFPAVLLLSAGATPSALFARFGRLLGLASYAIYILHSPMENGFSLLWERMRGAPVTQDAPWSGVVFLLLMIAAALLADKVYDTPVRKALERRLLQRRRT